MKPIQICLALTIAGLTVAQMTPAAQGAETSKPAAAAAPEIKAESAGAGKAAAINAEATAAATAAAAAARGSSGGPQPEADPKQVKREDEAREAWMKIVEEERAKIDKSGVTEEGMRAFAKRCGEFVEKHTGTLGAGMALSNQSDTYAKLGEFDKAMESLRGASMQSKDPDFLGMVVSDFVNLIRATQGPGMAAPDFAGTSIDGKKVALKDFRGQFVLLDIWATWCGPCLSELPFLKEAYAKYHDKGLEIFSVSVDDDEEKWRTHVKENDMKWVHMLNSKAEANIDPAMIYGAGGIPRVVLIDPQGVIVAVDGEVRQTNLETTLAKVFAAKDEGKAAVKTEVKVEKASDKKPAETVKKPVDDKKAADVKKP